MDENQMPTGAVQSVEIKKKFPAWLIIVVMVVLIAGLGSALAWYMVTTSQDDDQPVTCTLEAYVCPDGSTVGKVPPDCEFAECPTEELPGLEVYKNDKTGVEFSYPSDELFLYDLETEIFLSSRGETSEVSGVKLVLEESVEILGNDDCFYGEKGLPEECSVKKEPGISFLYLNEDYDSLIETDREYFGEENVTDVTVGGKDGVMYEIGAEGDGVFTYLIPLDEGVILVIRRDYRFDQGKLLGGREGKLGDLFEEILETVKFNQ